MKKVITSQASEWFSVSSSPVSVISFFFFLPLLLFYSIGVVRWCWRLLTFLFGASEGDMQNKSPPLEGMSLACDSWK